MPVRLALLAAAMKLFFRRPPECQKLLGSVLAAASSDTNQDVHDRALLYYRCPALAPPKIWWGAHDCSACKQWQPSFRSGDWNGCDWQTISTRAVNTACFKC